jgi:hypothetical protein
MAGAWTDGRYADPPISTGSISGANENDFTQFRPNVKNKK